MWRSYAEMSIIFELMSSDGCWSYAALLIIFLLMAEITELQRQYDVMCPKTQVWS